MIGWTALAPLTLLLELGGLLGGLQDMRSSRENLSVINHGERTTGTIISKHVSFGEYFDSIDIKYTFTISSGQEYLVAIMVVWLLLVGLAILMLETE